MRPSGVMRNSTGVRRVLIQPMRFSIVVVTFGVGVTSLGVLFALDGEIWPGAVLCVCGAVCILAGTFASRSRRQPPGRHR